MSSPAPPGSRPPKGDLAPDREEVRARSGAVEVAAPTTEDGRNIDPEIGTLEGEGALLKSTRPRAAAALGSETLARAPMSTPTSTASTTYYEQPVLKAPVWKAWIPTYLFVGGLAGGAAVLGAAMQVAGGRRARPLVLPARWIAAGGIATSAALLTADLGRPSRFLNMLRVFRPTSPMNMGTWLLSAAGLSAGASAVLPVLGARRPADVAGVVAGALGLGVSTYTGVLLANTATPAWQHGRRALPALFAASAAASAGSALELVPGASSSAARVFSTAGKVGELAYGAAYEVELSRAGASVVRHARGGRAGLLLNMSRALTAGSLALSRASQRSAKARVAGALLGLAGALVLRFAVMEAGKSSAVDPRATFEPQRRARARRSRYPGPGVAGSQAR